MPGALADLNRLRSTFRGDVLTAEDPGYNHARKVFNVMIDKCPALIAKCANTGDVSTAITFARSNDLPIVVRGGGHSVGGKSVRDGALLIDLSMMKGLEVDAANRRARAQPGILLGELDEATARHGLATPLGTVSRTGIAGLTLGGGLGWLNGIYGLSCDNVTAAEVVLADGLTVRADAQENTDLFWGIRGGSGNFGVVTSFEYELHPCETVLGGLCLYPFEQAHEVVRYFLDFSAEGPDELSTMLALLSGPDQSPAVAVAICYCGPIEEGERVVAPLRGFGPPSADQISPMRYTQQQQLLDAAFPDNRRHYWKSAFASKDFSDEAVKVMVEMTAQKPSPHTIVYLQQIHGTAARVPVEKTAFAHRGYRYDFAILSQWENEADDALNIDWTRNFFEAISPHLETAVYVNNLGDEGDERARDAYGANYERLTNIKKKYDPTNFFSSTQNVKPTISSDSAIRPGTEEPGPEPRQ